MKIIDVLKRPKYCPKCGAEMCDILYGEPTSTWEQDYLKETGHKSVLGGCIITEDSPDYQCDECRLHFKKIEFPRNAKALARKAMLEKHSDIFCDVEYYGLVNKIMMFLPVVKPGICWDGDMIIYVRQNGRAYIGDEVNNRYIHNHIAMDKERFNNRSEGLYRRAAMREIKGDEYYDSVRKVGMLSGKRIYQPVLKEEYLKEPPKIGLPMAIIVNENGQTESIRDLSAIDIIKRAGKRKKK